MMKMMKRGTCTVVRIRIRIRTRIRTRITMRWRLAVNKIAHVRKENLKRSKKKMIVMIYFLCQIV